jgi:hypothetical protein
MNAPTPNGNGTALSSLAENAVPALSASPSLEERVAILEAEQKRFTDALIKAGEFIFNSPQGKMISMAFPKAMQEAIKEFFHANS